jgi:4-amino-4-deoxy-L-arabinose transferase-like glycosyltransferase
MAPGRAGGYCASVPVIPNRFIPHWPLALLLAAAAVMLFMQLGRDFLWEDEGDTAVLAANTLTSGLPKAWDGVTFTESDHGARLTSDLVMISHPWLQYYVVAGSFAIFGENAFAARLPFALASLGTVVFVYLLTWRATGRRRAAVSAAALLVLCSQFLIFGRQARNYALHELLTCALIWQFFRVRDLGSMLVFAVIGVLLFQAHPIGLAAVGAMALLVIVSPSLAPARRWVLAGAAIVGLTAVPWLWAGARGYTENTALMTQVGQVPPRLAQYLIECASVTPLVAVTAFAGVLWWRYGRRVLTAAERKLVLAVLAVVVLEAGVMALTQSRDALWVGGIRHTPEVLPLVMILTGIGAMKLARSRLSWVTLLAVLTLTTVGRLTPWAFWGVPMADRDPNAFATVHLPPAPSDRWLKTSLLGHMNSLVTPNPGTIELVSDYLNAHASPGDIVVTNYEWDALYFHTGLHRD